MISTLRISRFKSIKELALDCRRINIFIGPPNTGKSNILEALSMFSFLHYGQRASSAKEFVRFERTSNLFYDGELDYPLLIECSPFSFMMEFKNGGFVGRCNEGQTDIVTFTGDHTNFGSGSSSELKKIAHFKLYRFAVKETFPRMESEFLLPPSGENLLSLLLAKKELKAVVDQSFSSMGLRLLARPHENKLEVVKLLQDIVVSYPYSLTSETLQRVTFYLAAILSNQKSILIFEEPEAHSFPYYTKYLAELIALDQNENQYFISTHNPYFLLPILDKAPKEDVAVHIVYFHEYETKTKQLTEKDLEERAELDIFSNLDRYLADR